MKSIQQSTANIAFLLKYPPLHFHVVLDQSISLNVLFLERSQCVASCLFIKTVITLLKSFVGKDQRKTIDENCIKFCPPDIIIIKKKPLATYYVPHTPLNLSFLKSLNQRPLAVIAPMSLSFSPFLIRMTLKNYLFTPPATM